MFMKSPFMIREETHQNTESQLDIYRAALINREENTILNLLLKYYL